MQSSNNTVPEREVGIEADKIDLTFQHCNTRQFSIWEAHPEERISLISAFKSSSKLKELREQDKFL